MSVFLKKLQDRLSPMEALLEAEPDQVIYQEAVRVIKHHIENVKTDKLIQELEGYRIYFPEDSMENEAIDTVIDIRLTMLLDSK